MNTAVKSFDEFCSAVLSAGFSTAGNSRGLYTAIPFTWETEAPADSPVRWHTGDPDTDPWEWRMRVLEERDDIAYSKLFFRSGGYIAKELYPYFYSVRRQGNDIDELYADGKLSREAKVVYDALSGCDKLAYNELKQYSAVSGSQFERALVELQMFMLITICGRTRKLNKLGEPYGWSITVFQTVERFWEERGLSLGDSSPDPDEALDYLTSRVASLCPTAPEKLIFKFIKG